MTPRRATAGTISGSTGYPLDIAMDADSEFITAIDVLPANADEAANASRVDPAGRASAGQ